MDTAWQIFMFVTVASWLVISLGRLRKRCPAAAPEPTPRDEMEAKRFIDGITELGYFRYAAPEDVEMLRADQYNHYHPDGALTSSWDENSLPKDYRLFFFDGEEIFETGGVNSVLQAFEPAFLKMGFSCTVDSYSDVPDWGVARSHQRVGMNGSVYDILEDFRSGYGWLSATKSFADMLNAELSKQSLVERVYLINGGNDGQLAFLTTELYQFIHPFFNDPYRKPLEPAEWENLMLAD
jgi:hypothetical protein